MFVPHLCTSLLVLFSVSRQMRGILSGCVPSKQEDQCHDPGTSTSGQAAGGGILESKRLEFIIAYPPFASVSSKTCAKTCTELAKGYRTERQNHFQGPPVQHFCNLGWFKFLWRSEAIELPPALTSNKWLILDKVKEKYGLTSKNTVDFQRTNTQSDLIASLVAVLSSTLPPLFLTEMTTPPRVIEQPAGDEFHFARRPPKDKGKDKKKNKQVCVDQRNSPQSNVGTSTGCSVKSTMSRTLALQNLPQTAETFLPWVLNRMRDHTSDGPVPVLCKCEIGIIVEDFHHHDECEAWAFATLFQQQNSWFLVSPAGTGIVQEGDSGEFSQERVSVDESQIFRWRSPLVCGESFQLFAAESIGPAVPRPLHHKEYPEYGTDVYEAFKRHTSLVAWDNLIPDQGMVSAPESATQEDLEAISRAVRYL
ncbi:hypothetical protein BCR37DRAFT_389752 [Protomyces lactucae-debilis]|uniref:Uncharacterized protein n=1 Tax=Protomyces lactucae-debilis TaxID=2754530 RepID=A0A1Y2EU83_PROLT|nr:uncharacterized protein BCR37DRAFT_389752 [Protomyces lactucae-debilis]ORY75133.1 hypothetical protein BCR37DRAFT_389752 [Protomyces lactucae-debilis]